MYTTYHDAHRCFEETLSASKLDTLVERGVKISELFPRRNQSCLDTSSRRLDATTNIWIIPRSTGVFAHVLVCGKRLSLEVGPHFNGALGPLSDAV